ncbi:MAG TPA: hypothetical protein VMN60_00095 [Longimicrobiales bacterium]|nr:hypothetical protein [Longimicrobiales bacterium]
MVIVAALLQLGAALPPDSVDALRSRARSAEARYERLVRSTAPFSWGSSGAGSRCDEIVGRFCITFDSLSYPPAGIERPEVDAARGDAIEAARRFFSAAPSDRAAAGPLVRLLVHDARPSEAVSAAGAFAALSSDSLWADLLLGFSLHAAGADSAAVARFDRALARMDSTMRQRWLDPAWLLDDAEWRAVRRLGSTPRDAYERRLWRLADPFWMTRANEAWVEHMARHTESALLRTVPVVAGMTSWGQDVYELTVRYGTPTARTRVDGPIAVPSSTLVEYWDSASRSYVPQRLLLDGYATAPEPGRKPLLYAARARTGYAWRAVTRVLEPPHQVTRFVAGSNVVIRVDATVRADSAAARSSLVAALFVADSSLSAIRGARAQLSWRGDSVRVTRLTATPPGYVYYSLEGIDTVADVAVRARYALSAHLPRDPPWLSDILVCEPFAAGVQPARFDDPALRARPSLMVARGDTLGVYAEVYRLQRTGPGALEVELALERADAPSVVRRLFEWVGRSVGLLEPGSEPRVAWRAEALETVHTISLNLPLDARLSGRYTLMLRITDRASGRSAVSRRLIVIGS